MDARDPLAMGDEAAMDWAEARRVPWALLFTMRRAGSAAFRCGWSDARRAFVVTDHEGREVAAHPADDPFWWGGDVPPAEEGAAA